MIIVKRNYGLSLKEYLMVNVHRLLLQTYMHCMNMAMHCLLKLCLLIRNTIISVLLVPIAILHLWNKDDHNNHHGSSQQVTYEEGDTGFVEISNNKIQNKHLKNCK